MPDQNTPNKPRDLSPVEQFGEMRQRKLEEYRNTIPDRPGNKTTLDFLSKCRVENIDISGDSEFTTKLRNLFSSPERKDKITHLPCFICPAQDGKEMTIPLVPIQMASTVDVSDQERMQYSNTSYVIRTNPYEDDFMVSYFSDTAAEEYFGLLGISEGLPGYLFTEDEAFYLWKQGGLDAINMLLAKNELGWYLPSSNRVYNSGHKSRIWISGTVDERKCINFGEGEDVEIGASKGVFGYPMLCGRLDVPAHTYSSVVLQKLVGDKVEGAL